MKFFRWLIKIIPTFLMALILAVVVWVSAVISADPNEEDALPSPIRISVLGLDPDLIIVNDIPNQVTLSVRAPRSVLARLISEGGHIKVSLDLSGLKAGNHTLEPQVNIDIGPTEVIRISPTAITVTLEAIETRDLPIEFVTTGTLPISYEAGDPELSAQTVQITGPQSAVESVTQVLATIDLTDVTVNINKQIELRALNENGVLVSDVSLSPSLLQVQVPITQLGGYRNVFVKIITIGQIARGFYLTNIFASPPTLTIYTPDPEVAKAMPAFIETIPINLNGADEDFEIDIPLNLPQGIVIIGDQTITVQVGVAAIESSINFLNVPIQIINLGSQLEVVTSAEEVDVYLSGPIYLLDELTFDQIIVVLDLTDRVEGTYQLAPQVESLNDKIKVDAILPGTIEVTISRR